MTFSQQPLRLLLTGGGSGGPTTPLLAVYDQLLRDLGPEQVTGYFLGTESPAEKTLVERAGLPFQAIPSGKLRRYWSWRNFLDPILVLAGFFVGLKILWQFRPQVVVSAGSFVSVPVAYAAWLLRIPHVILQMDVKPGLANRLMAPVSDRVAYLFEETAPAFGRRQTQKISAVVRTEICEAQAERAQGRFGLKPERPVLLVTGGGQGALALNGALAHVLDFLLERFQVVHLTGRDHAPISCHHPDYHPIPFVSEGMGDLLARSNLVVTRAGLGIIGELAYLGKDAILVPIPGSHQELNAQAVVAHQGGIYLPQAEFLNRGQEWWSQFFKNYRPGEMGQRLQAMLPPGGTAAFAQLILQARRNC